MNASSPLGDEASRWGYASSRHFDTSAGRVCYLMRGSGPVILLIHGIPLSLITWRHNVDELAREHTVIAADLIGFGRSEKNGKGYSPAEHASYLVELLRGLGVHRCAVMGSSYGCSVALEMAVAEPDLVDKVMLINSVGVPKGRHSLERFVRIGIARAAISNLLGSERYGQRIVSSYLAKAYAAQRADVTELARIYYGMLADGGVESYLKTLAAFDEERTFELFKQVKQRTLLFWGRHDHILSAKNARILEARLNDAKVIYMNESGHVPHEEEPAVMNRLVGQFIGAGASGGRMRIQGVETC